MFYLKYWRKELSQETELERLYLTDEKKNSRGYFERRTVSRPRESVSYYDRHRIAKGDLYDTKSKITITIEADDLAALKAAIIAAEPAWSSSNFGNPENFFAAAKEFTRGIDWVGPRRKTLLAQAAAFGLAL